jgi:hypothetical protein
MENNKKIMLGVGAVVLAVVAFVLGGSGSSTDSSSNPQPTNTYTPNEQPTVPSYSSEDSFLAAVNGAGNSIVLTTSDSDLLNMGWGVCDVLDEGYTLDDIANELIYNSDLSTEEEFEAVGVIMAGAVSYLCPEYQYMIDDFIEGNSY